MIKKDLLLADATIPAWETYQRGLEALAGTYKLARGNKGNDRRSSSIGDLLVKVFMLHGMEMNY